MEFWGVEVEAGKPIKVTPDEDTLIHISQASLGESKDKKGAPVHLFVKIGNQKLVLATLSQEHCSQTSFDLVFEKEFELSHNWKNGPVYFIGYKSPNVDGEDEEGFFSGSEESDEEDVPVPAAAVENGNAKTEKEKAKAKAAKPEANPKAKAAEVKKEAKPELVDDESDEDDESDDDLSDSEDEEGVEMMDEDDDDEETPKKVEQSKKRATESASKTPVPAKKAKAAAAAATPQKMGTADGKKGGHTATPHPAKKGGKTPSANANQSPKSGGQFSCGSCKKSFNSDVGLQSHNKAKHAAK